MTDFHFLRPLWLLLLPLALLLLVLWYRRRGQVGNWANVVAPALLPYVVSRDAGVGRLRRWATIAGGLALLLAVLALSGPTWERLPAPALRSTEALVVVLDLSRSMDATDIEPTRLARAKLKILDLLARRMNGQTALVVFSTHAFTVTPLTDDTATIAALVNSLSTDLMPSQGSYPDTGLSKAVQLLDQAGVGDGEILLITDAGVDPLLEKAVKGLNAAGHRLHVLGVGTAAGAPIPRANGGFLTNQRGEVVVPRLDSRALSRLADLGNGGYATLSADDSDITRLLDAAAAVGAAVEEDQQNMQTVLWHDRGPYLVVLLLPMMLYAFRRGLIAALVVAVLLPPVPAKAVSWDELWLSPDQRAAQALAAGDDASAAALFADERWRAAASYRAGDYQASAEALAGLDGPEDLYNLGNALARSGDLNGALQAYEQSLALDPEHEDAIYNRDLLLEQMPPPEQQQGQDGQDGEQGQENDPGENQDSAAGEPQSGEGDGEQQQDQQQDGEQPSSEQDSQEQAGEDQQQQQSQAEAEESLDEWASEQAADQWLRRIPDDPGGLLRRKFRYQYQRLGQDQDGNSVWPGNDEEPY